MEIVIDINDNEYLGIKNYHDNITSYPVTIHLYDAVRNGTPLPKEHGRLIDADALYDQFEYADYDFEKTLEYAPTIIEADKVESEENDDMADMLEHLWNDTADEESEEKE